MRKVASYVFEQAIDDDEHRRERFRKVCSAIDEWIKSKGDISADGQFQFSDGRKGLYEYSDIRMEQDVLVEHLLQEMAPAGPVRTDVSVGLFEQKILVYVEIRAAGAENQVGPLNLDIRCPQIVRTILRDSNSWALGGMPLPTTALKYFGQAEALQLAEVIWHPDRNLPIVCISEDEDGVLAEDLPEKLAADLCGLAIVAHIDRDAAWTLTDRRGQEWSCFNGAIRIYWPKIATSPNPDRHPLWTKSSLLRQTAQPEDAARKFRRQIRRRILGLSAFSVNEPPQLRQIRQRYRNQESEQERQKLQNSSDWKKLADSYAVENDSLREQVGSKDEEIDDLRYQLANLQEALQWVRAPESDVAPQAESPPTTVAEAVERARQKFSGTLYFGGDVIQGINTLTPNAGPPDKVLDYLENLHEMAASQAAGPLGVSQIQWLNSRGIHASGESETIKNSEKEMRKRTWAGLSGSQRFEMHLKPNEGVHPDKCVRIYFDFDHLSNRVVIGWIGRHPG